MNESYNKETGVTTWLIDTWFKKLVYVVGWITVVLMSISFTLGFLEDFFSVV